LKTLVLTGAAGHVGRALRPILRAHWHLILVDRVDIEDVRPGETVVSCDIGDLQTLTKAFRGAVGVVHLAGCTTEEEIEEAIAGNVQGAWNVFEAARTCRIERVVFASTHHVVGHYPRHRRFGANVLLRPDSRYGLTKAFGEQVGALFADRYGQRVLVIRIGYMGERPIDRRRLSIWISPRDLAQLVEIGLNHPTLRYAVVYGVSANSRSFFDDAEARRLGYVPQDSADMFEADVFSSVPPEDPELVGTHVIGGGMASDGYEGDIRRIDEW
jgi:uronate dehydrogenase